MNRKSLTSKKEWKKKEQKIWIVLVDDWELRGNGLGNVIDSQYKPALKLMDLYEELDIKGVFNIEVMQQLVFERYASAYEEIKKQRDFWLKTVRNMLQRGFDIQLHIHPQWHDASYNGKFWKLDKRWNIADYSQDLIEKFVSNSINYLNYVSKSCQPISFRGGAWGVCCPSRPLFETLEKHGIKIDISIVQNIYFEGESIKLDYTNLECPYFPYYPDYDDVRKISATKTNIIEIPTQSFSKKEISVLRRLSKKFSEMIIVTKKILSKKLRTENTNERAREIPDFATRDPRGFESGKAKCDCIVDLTNNKFSTLRIGLDIIVKRALRECNASIIPLVLESHTKDLTDEKLKDIRRLVQYIKKKYSNIVYFASLKEIAENIDLIKPMIKK